MSSTIKVLVVDDEPQIQRFLRPSLEASGFRVVSAESAAEALRVFQSSTPDLVILDLGLPDADGQNRHRSHSPRIARADCRALRARPRK